MQKSIAKSKPKKRGRQAADMSPAPKRKRYVVDKSAAASAMTMKSIKQMKKMPLLKKKKKMTTYLDRKEQTRQLKNQ